MENDIITETAPPPATAPAPTPEDYTLSETDRLRLDAVTARLDAARARLDLASLTVNVAVADMNAINAELKKKYSEDGKYTLLRHQETGMSIDPNTGVGKRVLATTKP
jgi:hypothetical protein